MNLCFVQTLISVSSVILCNTGAWEVIEVSAGCRDFYKHFIITNRGFLSIMGNASFCLWWKGMWSGPRGWNIYLWVLSCVCVCVCVSVCLSVCLCATTMSNHVFSVFLDWTGLHTCGFHPRNSCFKYISWVLHIHLVISFVSRHMQQRTTEQILKVAILKSNKAIQIL